MKKINTQGITDIGQLNDSDQWYWGMDYTYGDLYEAEQLFKQNHSIQKNRLILVHYPDGEVIEPITLKDGQYFGCPIFYDNQVVLLVVDFMEEKINILSYNHQSKQISSIACLSLSIAEDCYNLILHKSPLMLTRSPHNNIFQILWPEQIEFEIENTESFSFASCDKLYFSVWYEDPDYSEEVIVRDKNTGKIIEKFDGTIKTMPDSQNWIFV